MEEYTNKKIRRLDTVAEEFPIENIENTFPTYKAALPPKEIKKPFPYFPAEPTIRMLTRFELLRDLDKWDNNDIDLAKKTATIFIELLKNQFEIV